MKSTSKFQRLLGCLLVLLGGVLSMAPTPCNLKIAEYPGSSEKEGREGTSDVYAFDHELIQPVDPLTGQATSQRQHKALSVLKVIDKATPGLNKALSTGQNLKSVILDFYRIDPATRVETKYYTITLMNARIIGTKIMMPTSLVPANESYRHMEEVRFVYEAIEWNWIPDNIIEGDNWQAPGRAAASTTEKAGAENKDTAEDAAGANALAKVRKTSAQPAVKTKAEANSPDKK